MEYKAFTWADMDKIRVRFLALCNSGTPRSVALDMICAENKNLNQPFIRGQLNDPSHPQRRASQ